MRDMTSAIARAGMIVLAATMPLVAGEQTPVPEPSSMLLVGGGIAALILIARKKRAGK